MSQLEPDAFEWQAFFMALQGLNEGRRTGTAVDHWAEELEAIVMHTEQPRLRERASQTLALFRLREAHG